MLMIAATNTITPLGHLFFLLFVGSINKILIFGLFFLANSNKKIVFAKNKLQYSFQERHQSFAETLF